MDADLGTRYLPFLLVFHSMKGVIEMRILLFCCGLFFVLFCGVAFGQGAGGQQVALDPLIDFEDVFQPLWLWFSGVLREHLGLLLSVFFIWFIFMCAMSFLQGRADRLVAEQRIREAVRRDEALFEARIARREARRIARRESYLLDREIGRTLGNYSDDIRSIIRRESEHLGDNESIVRIDGSYYVRSETNEGDVIGYRTLSEFRSERGLDQSYPFSVGSGRSYGDESDDQIDFLGNRMSPDREYCEYQEERESFSEEEADFQRWQRESRSRLWEWFQSDRQRERERFDREYDNDDGFDRDNGNRRRDSGGY